MRKTVLKIFAAVCGASALLLTAACSSYTPKGPATELELKMTLEKRLTEEKSGDKVLEILFGDYDGDGSNEAFAVTGDESKAGLNQMVGKKLNEGALWFVSRGRAELLRKKSAAASAQKLQTEKNTYCVYEEYGKDSSLSYVWRVRNGEPAEEKISGKVGGVKLTDDGITAALYAEDAMCFEEDGELICYGTTQKPYYFFDDGEGLKEYGAVEIKIEDFLRLDGAEKILDEIEEKNNKVISLFYRGNGLININYRRKAVDEYICGNSTVKYDGSSVEKYRSHNGVYAAAATDSAEYPESPFQ